MVIMHASFDCPRLCAAQRILSYHRTIMQSYCLQFLVLALANPCTRAMQTPRCKDGSPPDTNQESIATGLTTHTTVVTWHKEPMCTTRALLKLLTADRFLVALTFQAITFSSSAGTRLSKHLSPSNIVIAGNAETVSLCGTRHSL